VIFISPSLDTMQVIGGMYLFLWERTPFLKDFAHFEGNEVNFGFS